LVGISCGPLYFLAIASCLPAAVAVDAVAAAAIPAVTAPAVFRKLRLEVMRTPFNDSDFGPALNHASTAKHG
jgi:hypothetical protein